MNFLSNPFFSLYYQQPYVETSVNQITDGLCQQQNEKYLRILESQNQLLKEKVQSLQEKLKKYEQVEEQLLHISKTKRKTKQQKSAFQCQYPQCKRLYKSTLALNLHIKMKHNGGSIRERQAYAKLIVQCQRDSKPKPQININFPPRFLENYRKRTVQTQNMLKQRTI